MMWTLRSFPTRAQRLQTPVLAAGSWRQAPTTRWLSIPRGNHRLANLGNRFSTQEDRDARVFLTVRYQEDMTRPDKRPALADGNGDGDGEQKRDDAPVSLTHPVSPPVKKRRLAHSSKETEPPARLPSASRKVFDSPFRLTKIRDLPRELNKDAITLKQILGDPLIAECWEFNYLHDIELLMAAFDPDVRHLVKVHVVHGFWKKEDPSRLELEKVASRFQNVTLHSAFMPEMYGTHHSKMMILLRHDDTAQIVIHTANMIFRDWANMTQAVWLSPRLPLMEPSQHDVKPEEAPAGSGAKFKIDLLNYLRAYDTRRAICKPIIDQLSKHDFSSIRGSLIASVPGRHKLNDASPTRWGWAAMEQALKSIPVSPGKSDIAIQISSIATLGPTDAWLRNTLFRSLSGGRPGDTLQQPPNFQVIFPTPDEIRKSLDGYNSGASIHTKIQSAQQVKQLAYLRPMLHHWANDLANGAGPRGGKGGEEDEGSEGKGKGGYDKDNGDDGEDSASVIREAGRKRAAPHIKTYIRYGDKSGPSIDWALVTSANLSKQAWGEAAVRSADGALTMRIASYEIGVLVWPELYGEGAVMRGTFLTDSLGPDEVKEATTAVALRMPYNLPLQPYGEGEMPWVATADYSEPDWKGQIWVRRG